MFEQILATNQNDNISLELIFKNLYIPSINDFITYPSNKLSKRSGIVSIHHTLHRKIQKKVNDYSKKYIDDFKLIVVDTSPKLNDR